MSYQEERSRKSKWFFRVIKALEDNNISIVELGYKEKNKEVTLVTNTASADLMLIGKGYKVAVVDGTIYVEEGNEISQGINQAL